MLAKNTERGRYSHQQSVPTALTCPKKMLGVEILIV